MTIYNFTRNLVDGRYDINNQYCVDGGGNRVTLSQEIKNDAAVPDDFNIKSVGTSCDITFSVTLDGAQQSALNTIVAAHKAHTGA